MATTENEVNTALGELLRGMKSDWRVLAEQTRQLKSGAGRRVDVLIQGFGGTVIAIETEFLPARTVEEEAFGRLGEKLEVMAGTIDTAIAVKVPEALKKHAGATLRKELLKVEDFQYAVYTTRNEAARPLDFEQTEKKRKGEGYVDRFPQEGWLTGSLKDLAVLAQGYTIPPDVINEAADIIQYAIHEFDGVMNRDFGDTSVKREVMAKELLQRKDDKNIHNPYQQIYRMIGAIFLNALVFHDGLSKEHAIRNIDNIFRPENDNEILQKELLDEWYKILKINYYPIFIIAINILGMLSLSTVNKTLKILFNAANKIISRGSEKMPGLFGIVFQRLISDRKFLATFYTRPDAAVLLANLAISEETFLAGKGWEEAEAIKALKIADFSCGTGTLLGMAYQRIAQLHELHGGSMSNIHNAMMEHVITGLDIMPSGVHLTATTLASFYYKVSFKDTKIYTLAFGANKDDHITTGSLELLDPFGNLLLPPATYQMRGKGKEKDLSVENLAPNECFDLVIMNPPYTRATNHEGKHADIVNPAFAAFGMDIKQQRRLAERTKYLLKSIKNNNNKNNYPSNERPKVANGYAGLGSYFFQIADMKLHKNGQLAMVLPLSFVVGSSWQGARSLIAQHYEDIIVVTIAQSKTEDRAFSADTSMAECLLLARKTDTPPSSNRIISVALNERPGNSTKASEIAKLIKIHKKKNKIPRLEDAPIGGALLKAGDTSLGQIIDVPVSHDGSCPALSLRSPEILQVAWILHNKQRLWLPRQSQEESVEIPITTIEKIATRGNVHRELNGEKRDGTPLGPFDIEPITDKIPNYPALWNHDAKKEQRMIVAPDSEGRVRQGFVDSAYRLLAQSIKNSLQFRLPI